MESAGNCSLFLWTYLLICLTATSRISECGFRISSPSGQLSRFDNSQNVKMTRDGGEAHLELRNADLQSCRKSEIGDQTSEVALSET